MLNQAQLKREIARDLEYAKTYIQSARHRIKKLQEYPEVHKGIPEMEEKCETILKILRN